MHGGMVILVFGIALAIFWTGFLRVGAQSALLLAPLSAAALLVVWLARALGV
jgi:CBS-domain-containing membrane protein